eukprot:TRINITY_DN5767_c0_g1_i2.p1 TRINITY_DN5767_c0_g1~~TRINITY_DN5767_c0_g1_i2.p1  ORF type:complete len:578 (+),score=210.79 TRINITY_DN5767_c0_g1_i2:71-1735(+)
MAKALLLCALLGAARSAAAGDADAGYEGLFADADEECDGKKLIFKGDPIPSYVRGVFMQTGPAKWSWRSNSSFTRNMTHALDGFSKVHRWEFTADGSVTFSSKFLQSGFMANSKKINDIAFNVMAQPTDPPMNHVMKQFTDAPNDNQNVNVVRLGDATAVLSDSATLMQIDADSLGMKWEYNGQGCKNGTGVPCTKMSMTNPKMQICGGGSAHPFFDSNGDLLGLRETNKYTSMLPGDERAAVYRVQKGDLATVEDVVTFKVKRSSYTHQMGLAKGVSGGADHAIVAAQPIHTNAMKLLEHGTLDKGFEADMGETTKFLIAPLTQGAEGTVVDSGKTFFFGHVVNSWLSADGKQILTDINMQDAIFFDRYSLNVQRSKQLRDAWPTATSSGTTLPHGYQTVTRYTVDLATQKLVSAEPVFGVPSAQNIQNEHDLFRLHPADYGRAYCGYWAWQAYYQSQSFASWAVVRTELCGEKPAVAAAWHRPNVYPGEASFVPKPGGTDKTEGVLLFKALDGNTGKSLLIVADAKTMATIAEAELPVHVPFTVHGNWFAAN